ncbi:MAG: hypothetical protein JWQ71_591 [Pedosphaera sp.]|nr:hypothetical protein [Pedosphaera sp.]
MLGMISLPGGILALLAFTFSLNAQIIREDSFETVSFSPLWDETKGAQIKTTGGANATRGFASLGSDGGELGGRLASANAPTNGLSDFYLEFYFRVRNTTNRQFNLQIAAATNAPSLSRPAVVNICYEPGRKWGVSFDSDNGLAWNPLPGLGSVRPEVWHQFRFTGRNWGGTNAHYDLQLSRPGELNSTTSVTNQTFNQGTNESSLPRPASHFRFSSASGDNSGFDVDGVCAGIINPYKGPKVVGVDTKTLFNKVMCGYQGWFGVPDDGSSRGWYHWTKRAGSLVDGNAKVDLWPDVSELVREDRFPTGFKMADGSPAEIFSSFKKTTVLKHFQWMQDYGLDGVFVQRFITEVRHQRGFEHGNTVLANCREGANLHGRTYAVMYDLSGLQAGHIEDVIKDWRALRRQMVITEDPAYLHHRGKPVVAVWGVGFKDRLYTLAECRRLVEFLKNDPEAGGCVVMLGVPGNWRELKNDAVSDPLLLEVIGMADIISPWTVGRYTNPAGAARYATNLLKPDQDWCQRRGIDYLPVVFPGFSWHNMYGSALNQIPRLRGQFLWSQFCEAKRAKASMLYVAMFDEVDEATAIFKCINDVPTGTQSKFVTFEGLPSDHYLKLVGAGAKLLRGEIPVKDERPF